MAKRKNRSVGLSAVDFVRGYTPLARAGKSALEIGKSLGVPGTDKEVASYVSVKSSQLRKKLVEIAVAEATAKGLSAEETAVLVQAMRDKLPKIKGANRPGRQANVMSAVLDALNNL